ncbi:carbohydrate kinase family protein [Roseateles sp.]|uniref:carbohydrate kinase family protein n=1 Tax=Roseateles sp. TaxID=1971397 RepID=UPI0025F28EAC|nr:carbohydrate kinase family protein [Roseateles sp.]MBV8035111.1 carbohydrate kinase family protein [Roseateles sp.]
MDTDRALFSPQLSIVGDVGADLVLGSLDGWPTIGTELLMPRSELRAGGSGANAALASRHIGQRTQLISAVGHDHFGRWLAEQFTGLRTHLEVCDVETTISVGLMHACGDRNFFTTHGHLQQLSAQHVLKHLQPAEVPAIALFTAPFLLTGLRARYEDLLAEASARGYRVALDTGWPPEGWDADTLAEVRGWLQHCDHLLINELEARSIAGTEDLDAALALIAGELKPGASLVVKVGARGAIGFEAGRRTEHGAEPANIFDTIGAGDAFNAGYLSARLRGGTLDQGLAAGCRTARAILSRFPRKTIRAGEFADCVAA